MSKHDIKKGDRVTWIDYKSDREVRGEVLKVFRNGRAQVLSGQDFQKYNIELQRLSVKQRQVALIEIPEIEEKPINHWEMDELDELLLPPNNLPPNSLPPNNLPPNSLPPNSLPPNSLPPNNLPPNNLPPNNLPPNNLPPNSWVESKKIRGQIYRYARWSEEVEVNGIKKLVKRSQYLEKATTDGTTE